MAPILPGISDRPEQLAAVVRAAREAGACGIWSNVLYLKPGTREHFLQSLEQEWPELLPRYEQLYGRRAYLPARETAPIRDQVRELARSEGVRDRRRIRLSPPPQPEQLRLVV
jgi:DNA repair photolyase